VNPVLAVEFLDGFPYTAEDFPPFFEREFWILLDQGK
jgi:hypothetical protein